MKITRNIAIKTLSLGNPETIVLPRNYAHRYLTLRLKGSVDVTAGTSAMTASAQGASKILSNIRIRRDGKEQVFGLEGALLYHLNKILYAQAPKATTPAVTNATNTEASVTLIVPFENVDGVKPFDTLLKGSGLSSLDLLVDTASAQSMMIGGNGSVAVNNSFTLEVDTTEEVGVNNYAFGDIRIYSAQKVAVSGASSSFQIKPLPVGNRFKGFLIFAEDGGSFVGSDSLITNFKLKSGTNVFLDRPAQALKDEYKTKKNITTMDTGVYYMDLMSDGMLNQCLDVTRESGNETLEMELVVAAPSGTANIYVVALEYVAPVVVAK